MTLQTLGPVGLPPGPELGLLAVATATPTVNVNNSTGEYCGAVFIAPTSFNLRKIGFYVSAAAAFVGTAVARVETMSAGLPSGTEVGTGTAFVPAATTWFWVTLTADAALTGGTAYFAGAKITAFTSGSFTSYLAWNNAFDEGGSGMPCAAAGTTPTKSDDSPILGLEDDAGNKVIVRGVFPTIDGLVAEAWSNASNPDRRGVRFKLPVPSRLVGVRVWGDWDSNLSVILYDSDGATALVTRAFVAADRASTTDDFTYVPLTPTELSKDVFYRLVILPTTANSRNYLYTTSVANAADLGCFPGGVNFHWTQVNGAPANDAAWTNTDTKRPLGLQLVFDAFDDAVSAASAGSRAIGRGFMRGVA